MALIRLSDRPHFRNPWAEFERIRQGLDELSRAFLGQEFAPLSRATVYPPLNIYETGEAVVVKAELPGIQADDLDISVEGDTLTIQGKRPPRQEGEEISYHRREINYGSFSRAVTLPTKIDVDKIEAKLQDGILTITLPKAEEVKPKKISVIAD